VDFSGLTAFECKLDDGLFHITLNRPDQGNVFGTDFCNEINVIVSEISERRDVRAVLISSKGRFFSLGGDITLMSGDRAALPFIVKNLTSPLHMAITRLMLMNAPVVCAVNGRGAFGGAAALTASADIVVAGHEAKFGSAFTGIGFSCDSGTTVALSHRMGISRAKRFLLLGETLDAQQALAEGLVDKVVPEEDLQTEALAIARKLASGPTNAFGEIKRLFAHVSSRSAASQMEEEAMALARVARTEDAWEGMTSFLQKRPAKFTGN
jgi:2-(1,2-epoxy-1,2-dihydrophenyl)acetyl-CoA isomerase